MKCRIFIGDDHDEEVLIYTHKRTELTDAIEQLVAEHGIELVGYNDREGVKINLSDVYLFTVEGGKVYAVTESERLYLRCRLYSLEETLPDNFVKINQSCIANIRKIRRFDTSITGTLLIKFSNGMSDYVSRRQLKNVKERLGL